MGLGRQDLAPLNRSILVPRQPLNCGVANEQIRQSTYYLAHA
jgi:hypothetical protein